MSTVFFDVGVSLDGGIAGPNRGPRNPLGDGAMAIHSWMFKTAAFCERLGTPGGERSPDSDLVSRVFERTGAYIMGRRMFEEGEVNWPEDAPFRSPVFVLTHEARAPWPRKGGTTFVFVTDGIASALAQARAAAGGKDVRVSGGAATIRQFIAAGLIAEFTLHIAPVVIRDGLRLLEQVGPEQLKVEQVEARSSALVTHVSYRVVRPSPGASA